MAVHIDQSLVNAVTNIRYCYIKVAYCNNHNPLNITGFIIFVSELKSTRLLGRFPPQNILTHGDRGWIKNEVYLVVMWDMFGN